MSETPHERMIRNAAAKLLERDQLTSQILKSHVTEMRTIADNPDMVIGVNAAWLIAKVEQMEAKIRDLEAQIKSLPAQNKFIGRRGN
jgi:hypothetical protein